MKKQLSIIFLSIFSLNLLITAPVRAEVVISDIKPGALQEGSVQISWMTNEDTTGYILFGKAENDMSFRVGDANFSRSHSSDLTGLKKDQEYYYKIFATNKNGEKSESFVNYIDTKNMPDTRAPLIANLKKLQSTDTAFAISFSTDEPVKITLKYGDKKDSLTKTWNNGTYKEEHAIIITGLKASTHYYFEISAKDKDNNLAVSTGDLTTASQGSDAIKMSKLTPESDNQAPVMAENAIITWESNLLATADIYYGLAPKTLNKNMKVSTTSSLVHRAILGKLEQNTTYYYQIKMKSELNKKDFTSSIYSFKTAAMDEGYLSFYFKSGDLVKYKSTTYFIYNDTKIALNSDEKIKTISSATPKTLEEKYFTAFKDGSAYYGVFHDGQLVKEEKVSAVYLIDGNYKRPIAKWEILKYLNYSARDIVVAKSGQLKNYKLGTIINHSQEITSSSLNNKLVKSPSGPAVYLIASGKKLPFFNQQAFFKYNYKFSDVKKISDQELQNIPEGQLIF